MINAESNMNFVAKILIISFFTTYTFAQKKQIDSLQQLISIEKIDSNKINLNNKLAWAYFQEKQASKAKNIVLENIEKAKKLRWDKGIAYSYETIGDFYYYDEHTDSSFYFTQNAVKFYKKTTDYKQICYILHQLGERQAFTKKFAESKQNLVESYDLAVKINSIDSQYSSLKGLGWLYHEMGNTDKSLDYFFQAEKLAVKLNDKQKQIDLVSGFSNNYIAQGKYKAAQIKLFEAIEYYKSNKNLHNYTFYLSTAANLYRKLNEPEKAEKLLLEVSKIQKQMKNDWDLITTFRFLGMLYTEQGKFTEAQYYLSQSLELSNRLKSSSDKLKAYYTLERLYFAKNDFIEGDKYQKKILQMRDSLYTAENNKALAEFDVKYKTAEKEKQLAESKLEIAQTRNWTIGLGIAFISFVGFGLLFWKIQKEKQRTALQTIEIENTRKILQAREIERQRIAKELHDSVGSQLTVVSTSLDNAFFLAENHKLIPQKLESINFDVREAAQSLRDTIWATHNTTISLSNLYSRIQHYLGKVLGENDKIECTSSFTGADFELNSIEALNFFRILQEAIQNIQKHSAATKVNFSLMNEENSLKLIITDNGKGFESNSQNPYENFGLSNMKHRSDEINATLTIQSEINKGTCIEVEIQKV